MKSKCIEECWRLFKVKSIISNMQKEHKTYIKREIGFLYHSELQFQNDFRLYFVIYHSLKNLYQNRFFCGQLENRLI